MREQRTTKKPARALLPAERQAAVGNVHRGVDEINPGIDRLWAAEAEERLAAWRRGGIGAIPLAEVLRKYGQA